MPNVEHFKAIIIIHIIFGVHNLLVKIVFLESLLHQLCVISFFWLFGSPVHFGICLSCAEIYGYIFNWLQTIWVCTGCVERCEALGCDAASTRSSSAEMCENSVQGESCYQSPSHEERHQGNRWESPVLQYEVYHQQANHWSQEWAISQTAPGMFYCLVLEIDCSISITKECIPFLACTLLGFQTANTICRSFPLLSLRR